MLTPNPKFQPNLGGSLFNHQSRYRPTLEEIFCYYSRTVSIFYDGSAINVVRESDKTLLELIPVGRTRDYIREIFNELKKTYILDYACEL